MTHCRVAIGNRDQLTGVRGSGILGSMSRAAVVVAVFAGPALAISLLAACAAPEPVSGEPVRQVGGAVGAVAVSADGDTAWLGTGRRLQGVDVSDPARPRELGQSDALPETIRGVAVAGDTVFAAVGTSGLVAFDVSDAAAPRIVSEIPTAWAVNDVFVDESKAYIAEGAMGIRVLDIADPADVRTLGAADTPGDALAVAADGGLAYVADWGTGVRVIDVSDPAKAREVGSVDTPGEAADVAPASDGLLLVADRSGGLRIVDVSDAGAAKELSAVDIAGSAERLAVAGDRVYVAAGDGGLAVVDIGDPTSPDVLEPLVDVTVAVDVAATSGHVFVADVGAPLPQPRGATKDLWAGLHMWGVQGRPEVAAGLAGLHIAGTGPDGLEPVGMYFSPSMIESVAVHERAGLVYLADGHAGVLVLDASDPSRPTLVASLETPGVAHDATVAGNRLLVADGPAGLTVVDISDPTAPRVVDAIDTPDEALGIATLAAGGDAGDGPYLAYVADGVSGLQVLDLARGEVVGTVDTPGQAWDVATDGAYAYVSDRTGGLRVYDLAHPTSPSEVAVTLEGQADVLDVVLNGDRAWVAAGPSGLHALDVSEPGEPRGLGSHMLSDRVIGVVIDGDRAFIAAGDEGLVELDVSDPSDMAETARWAMPGAAERLARLGDWVYVAAESGGLQLVPLQRAD